MQGVRAGLRAALGFAPRTVRWDDAPVATRQVELEAGGDGEPAGLPSKQPSRGPDTVHSTLDRVGGHPCVMTIATTR